MKSLTALLVGLRQLFSWRSTPRLSPRSESSDTPSESSETPKPKFAELLQFTQQLGAVECTVSQLELEEQCKGVSEVYTYHHLPDGVVGMGLISWMRKDRAFDYVKQAIIVIDAKSDDVLYYIEGPSEQIKPLLVKLLCYLKKPH